jgi:hypothetical protein
MRLGPFHAVNRLHLVDHKLVQLVGVRNLGHNENIRHTPAGIGHLDARQAGDLSGYIPDLPHLCVYENISSHLFLSVLDLGTLLLLALAAEARPGHRFQSGFRDGLLARLTHTESALPDPGQGLFDCSQEPNIGVVYTDLKLCFSVGVGLVNEIAGPLVCSWYRSFSAASSSRQFIQLCQQQSLVPI